MSSELCSATFSIFSCDSEIIAGMQKFAELTDQAKEALEARDTQRLCDLMNANFDLRRSLYGDEVIGETNVRMIELARQFGSSSKFPGSGGAVIGICSDPQELPRLRATFQEEGFVFCQIIPRPESPPASPRCSPVSASPPPENPAQPPNGTDDALGPNNQEDTQTKASDELTN
ncbi:probable glucuronokinase 2 [Acanthaster planci]|uniref:Probable glucuronokinase 2 n=1 Tax=Acanthaster planci TaxID=133434 RepID=A0A8B7ZZZ4_ACAPL|nr:probable glucuronokinase 2 [Acanthaster planci]